MREPLTLRVSILHLKKLQPQRARGEAHLSVKSKATSNDVATASTVDQLYQRGCAKIRIPKNLKSGADADNNLDCVMINSSGGLTGGDRMNWQFHAQTGSRLQITTQAAERVYKAPSGVAEIDITLSVSSGGHLSWLPQETILFDQSAMKRSMAVQMSTEATALIVEPIVFGRQAMGETEIKASLSDNWNIHLEGRLFHKEALHLNGNISEILDSRFVADGARALATLLFIHPNAEDKLAETRKIIGSSGAATAWNGRLLVRCFGKEAYDLRQTILPLIRHLNEPHTVPKNWIH